MAKWNQFQDKFSSEKYNKHKVNPIQNVFHVFTLVICFYHHCDHIKADKYHDADVKYLFGDKIKDHALEFVLGKKQTNKQLLCYA